MRNSVFDTQKRELEHHHARSPEEQNGIAWAFRLNRQAFGFAAEGRNLEAHVQYMFVEAVTTAIRNVSGFCGIPTAELDSGRSTAWPLLECCSTSHGDPQNSGR